MNPEEIKEYVTLAKHTALAFLGIGVIVVVGKIFKFKQEMNPINEAAEAYNADYDRVSRLIERATAADKDALIKKIDAIEEQYSDKLPDYQVKMGTMGLKAKLETMFMEREGIVKAITPTNSVG
ncbi:MAG: hypothetical protein ACTHMM_18285 [Agriterribacter sp.]